MYTKMVPFDQACRANTGNDHYFDKKMNYSEKKTLF